MSVDSVVQVEARLKLLTKDDRNQLSQIGVIRFLLVDRVDHVTLPHIRDRRGTALNNLTRLVEMRTLIEAEIARQVGHARESNSKYYDYGAPTWEDIGKKLGISKQAAHARYGKSTTTDKVSS